MIENLSEQIERAKRDLDELNEARQALPALREEQSRETYRVKTLDICLHQLEEQIRELESSSLANLFASMTGGKERKLVNRRTEHDALQQEKEACALRIDTLQREVATAESSIAALSHAEETYQRLQAQQEEIVMASEDGSARLLRDLTAQRQQVEGNQRKIEKAIEEGERVMERLHSMTRAVGRARSKTLGGGPLGLLGYVATSAIAAKGSSGSVNRAGEGLERFHRRIMEIELSEGSELDAEIPRMAAEVLESCASLGGGFARAGNSTSTAADAVQLAIGHLRSKLDAVHAGLKDLDRQRSEQLSRT